jgi:hypothetical protein
MMNNENDNKINHIFNSLDGSQRARIPDFFYTRLKARMDNELNKGVSRSWSFRPVYALGGLALLLAVNVVAVLQNDEADLKNVTADTETVQSAVEYYSLNDNSIYEITQEK